MTASDPFFLLAIGFAVVIIIIDLLIGDDPDTSNDTKED